MNECERNNGGCEHLCENEQGEFTCKCQQGFKLQEDDLHCAGNQCKKGTYYVESVLLTSYIGIKQNIFLVYCKGIFLKPDFQYQHKY